tara:strand:+ start:33 stop:539 length:507 start_codon:yes stop_codon:yes gene_type:complete
MLEKFLTKLKSLKTKQKIFLAVFAGLFLIQYFFNTDTDYAPYTSIFYVFIFSLIGIFVALSRRNKSRELIKDKSFKDIILNDYNLSYYASLSILSILYAIIQGALIGASFGFIFFAVGHLITNALFPNIGYWAICWFLVGLSRVLIEAVSLIFRVAQDYSKQVNKEDN